MLLCEVVSCSFVVWFVLFEVCCGVLFAIVFLVVASFLCVGGSCYVWIGVWCYLVLLGVVCCGMMLCVVVYCSLMFVIVCCLLMCVGCCSLCVVRV